jgi:PPIC-type PPIASE domain
MPTDKSTWARLNSSFEPGTRQSCVPALVAHDIGHRGYFSMRLQCLVYLLLASLAHGQVATPPAGTKAEENALSMKDQTPEIKVAPDDPVVTVNDFCADAAQQGDPCKTVITRAQFEKLTEALQPGMSLSLRLTVANAYARNLRMSAAAEKRGLDKTPEFQEEMRFARMQVLAQDLTRALRAEANRITDADVAEYYKKNQSAYEQATLARIFIPRAKSTEPAQADATSSAMEARTEGTEGAMTKLATDLRARAVKGEDPDKLQQEAYTAAGLPGVTPHTKMEKVRRTTLPPQHETVMDLKPGEVSEVFSDPGGAHFIYKMISKQTLTPEDAKMEISTMISTQRYRDSMKKFQGNVVFSDAYFNPPGVVATPAQRNRKGKRTKATAPDASSE